MIAVQGVGGGGGRNRLCCRVMYWTQMERGIPSHGGDFFGNLGTKNQVLGAL